MGVKSTGGDVMNPVIEQKRNELKEYCITRGLCGDTCPLWADVDNSCYENASDEVIERNYNIIFGTEDTQDNTPEDNPVTHPTHYTNGGMECIDEMVLIFGIEAVKWFCVCNAWKYRRRALYKNKEEDMEKSHWYLAKYKELNDVSEGTIRGL